MQCIDVVDRPSPVEGGAATDDDFDRRLRALMRLKALDPLAPARERRFRDIVAGARADAASRRPGARTAALSALDLLALEVCDD